MTFCYCCKLRTHSRTAYLTHHGRARALDSIFGSTITEILIRGVTLPQLAESYRRSHPKASIQRLAELSFELVDELHVLLHRVKCDGAACVIQVHPDPRGPGGVGEVPVYFTVPGGVARVGAEETPRLVVVAQQAVRVLPFATDAPVGHPDGKLARPLGLPVKPKPRQRLLAQHLREPIETLGVIRVKVDRFLPRHLLVAV